METNSDGSVNYWPGYVDAIINVVLNILFLVAAFAVSLATTDFSPPRPGTSTGPVAQTGAAPIAARKPDSGASLSRKAPPTTVIAVAPIDIAKSTVSPVKLIERTEESPERVFKVHFEPRDSSISEAQHGPIIDALRKGQSGPDARWILWSVTDVTNTIEARRAYLRAVAVRDLMIEAGVSSQSIQVRILGGAVLSADSPGSVFVAASPTSSSAK